MHKLLWKAPPCWFTPNNIIWSLSNDDISILCWLACSMFGITCLPNYFMLACGSVDLCSPVWIAHCLKRQASLSISQPWRAACFQGMENIFFSYARKQHNTTEMSLSISVMSAFMWPNLPGTHTEVVWASCFHNLLLIISFTLYCIVGELVCTPYIYKYIYTLSTHTSPEMELESILLSSQGLILILVTGIVPAVESRGEMR